MSKAKTEEELTIELAQARARYVRHWRKVRYSHGIMVKAEKTAKRLEKRIEDIMSAKEEARQAAREARQAAREARQTDTSASNSVE